jgi:ABC-type lipoprotein release transport system permease subunit
VGTRPAGIIGLVLYEVTVLAAFSVVIGTAAGCLVNYWLSIHGLRLAQGFTYGGMDFSTLYAEINVRSIIIPAVTVLVTAVLVSIFPALMAARTDPARAMRTQ